MRFLSVDEEPLCFRFAIDALLFKISMEIGIAKRARTMLPRGVATPFQAPPHVSGVRLLLDALAHVLLGIADFGPAVVTGDLGRSVGIDLRHRRSGGVDDLRCV